MKKILTLLVGVSILGFLFVGCQKDAVTATTKNHIKYDGKEYELSNALLINQGGSKSNGYYFDLILMSSGVKLYESNGEIDSSSGVGHFIDLPMVSSKANFQAGEYIYDAKETGDIGTFDYAFAGLDFNFSTEKGTVIDITGGKVTVKNTGTEYEITINCTTASNKPLTGYFKGTAKYYDYSVIDQALSFTGKKSSQKILLPLQAKLR